MFYNNDVCAVPAIVDAKTNRGPWAYLCAEHFATMGLGLGMGFGQILLCADDIDGTLIAKYLI